MASSQHQQHRIFIGNIPYDTTEQQLIQLCEDVGPVVSFRLVTDKETGRPKGYGFCEYKDEATALSARRNLQGSEINGRKLKVDFADNDVRTVNNQPIGLQIARTAAAAMAGALGGCPQQALANDPLTLHMATMSRSQLTQMISEVKGIAEQNKELAQELLLARPQLPKAILQAQFMLGMVTPQMISQLRKGNSDQPSQSQPAPFNEVPKSAEVAATEPPQFTPEVESALLQQVLSPTPEMVSSLSREQQQLVIQVQQMHQRDQKICCA